MQNPPRNVLQPLRPPQDVLPLHRGTSTEPGYLIAIVGSAGSLSPLIAIVRGLAADLDATVVVLVHRGAKDRSYLPAILSRSTRLPVTPAVDGEHLERARIYVAPPGQFHTTIEGRTIRLLAGPKVRYQRPAGDPLLYSAAAAFGSHAVGVVLSGMGQDGEAGVAAIKSAGGNVVVQSLAEAEYQSMPRHAMAVAAPDACLAAAEIAPRLLELCTPASPTAGRALGITIPL